MQLSKYGQTGKTGCIRTNCRHILAEVCQLQLVADMPHRTMQATLSLLTIFLILNFLTGTVLKYSCISSVIWTLKTCYIVWKQMLILFSSVFLCFQIMWVQPSPSGRNVSVSEWKILCQWNRSLTLKWKCQRFFATEFKSCKYALILVRYQDI